MVTIGTEFINKEIVYEEKNYKFIFIDIAGSEKDFLPKFYLKMGNAIILFVTNDDTFD